MNNFEQSRNEPQKGSTPPPLHFSDDVWSDILNTPKQTIEGAEKSRVSKEEMERSFGSWGNTPGGDAALEKAVAQEARVARLAQDQKAANDISEQIKKAA